MVKSAPKTPIKVPESLKKYPSSTKEDPKPSETASESKSDEKFSRKATNEEAKKYDFITARGIKRRTTSVSDSIALILRTSLGGGLLTIHVAVMECGAWTAMSLSCGVGFIISYCMYILVRSAQVLYGRTQVPSMTYPDLAEAAVLNGPWPWMRKYSMTFRYIVVVLKVITLFSCCYVYQVIGILAFILDNELALPSNVAMLPAFWALCLRVLMARIIKQLVDESVYIDDDIPPTLGTYAFALVVPIMCVCMMVRSLSYLAPFSMVADTVFILITASTAYYGVRTAERTLADMSAFQDKEGVAQYIGTFMFSAEGIASTLAIEGNMTDPKKIGLVISVGMSIVILMNAIVGFFGFWGFAKNCTAPITVNFPWTPFPIMLKAFTAVTMLVTYALNYWLPFDLLWYSIKPRIHPDRCKIWENVYRALFVIIISLIAGLLPNVQDLVSIIGSSFLIWIGIIFPAFIDLLVVWEDPGLGKLKWRLLADASMILGAIAVSIFGTTLSFISFVEHFYYGRVE